MTKMTLNDPSQELPRDETGSFLHLKLKRFPSVDALKMAYAKKTWAQNPQDAEIDIATSNRSKCRQCHKVILRGDLRARLWLQCHKGCKNSAYFHGKVCIWEYPETKKLHTTEEFLGFQKLDDHDKKYIEDELFKLTAKGGKRKPDAISSEDVEKQEPKKRRSK